VPPRNILFVDDDASLRLTVPAALEHHGYTVVTAATVREALKRIHAAPFDVLISDLNVGEPSDGFTVVSAMRRMQPNCLNIILTGFPAFEAALEAIRQQVDDFLVKPADVQALVTAIEQKVNRYRERDSAPLSMADFLRQNGGEILRRTLQAMKTHPQLGGLPLNDGDRIDYLPAVLTRIAAVLECADADQNNPDLLRDAAQHGRVRNRHGYSANMLVDDRRLLIQAIYEVVQENLLDLNLSRVIPDLQHIDNSLDVQLEAALGAYIKEPPQQNLWAASGSATIMTPEALPQPSPTGKAERQ
jgi:ActR/RegA family two-component response regulator